MPSAAMPASLELRQHLLLEAPIGAVEAVERHLYGVERVVVREHLQVDRWALVPREADEADRALLLRLIERLDDAALREVELGSFS